MLPKIPMQDDEIKMHKSVCVEFVDFRAGIRCAERVYDVANLIAERDQLRAEVERLQDQTNDRGRLAIDNGIRMERAEAEVERLKDEREAAWDNSKPLVSLMKEAQSIVESKHVFKKFVRGTPLENDVAVWMAEFAKENILASGAAPKEKTE